MPDRPNECAELLLALAGNPSPLFRQIAEAAVAGIDSIGMPKSKPDDTFRSWEEANGGGKRALASEFIFNLFLGLQHFNDGKLYDAVADKIASRPMVFHPVTLVVPAIERIRAVQVPLPPEFDRAIEHLWTSASEFLLLQSEVPPQRPSDWRLHAELTCNCVDCLELEAFALDPIASVHRFRVKKERRQHLHRVIEQHRLDMTHVTERLGSPQTMVCTKDRRTFKARMKEYKDEIAAMSMLVKLAHRSACALSKRMEAAVKMSAI